VFGHKRNEVNWKITILRKEKVRECCYGNEICEVTKAGHVARMGETRNDVEC